MASYLYIYFTIKWQNPHKAIALLIKIYTVYYIEGTRKQHRTISLKSDVSIYEHLNNKVFKESIRKIS